jgi:hypothetical protein
MQIGGWGMMMPSANTGVAVSRRATMAIHTEIPRERNGKLFIHAPPLAKW